MCIYCHSKKNTNSFGVGSCVIVIICPVFNSLCMPQLGSTAETFSVAKMQLFPAPSSWLQGGVGRNGRRNI